METGNNTVSGEAGVTEFFDLEYASEPASHYVLILLLQEDTLLACWYHSTKNLITGFASYDLFGNDTQEKIKSALRDRPFLCAEFQEVIALIPTPNFSIVPNMLKDYNAQELLGLTHKVDDQDELVIEKFVNLKAQGIFAISPEVKSLLETSWPKVRVLPIQIPLLEEQMNRMKHTLRKDLVLAHVHDHHVYIHTFRNGQLVLSNSYFQSGKEDLAYYLLYTAEILGVDPEKTPLHLAGEIEEYDDSWNLLKNYWNTLEVLSPLQHIELSKSVKSAPQNQYTFLTHGLLCVS